MIKKYSLSLPSEIVDEISTEYPDVPLSRIVAKLIRAGLDSTKTPLSQTSSPTVPTGITDTTELTEMIRSIVRAEITQTAPVSHPVVITEPVVIQNQHIPVPAQSQKEYYDPSEWLTNNDIYLMIADRYSRSTGTGKISRAVAKGKLISNGKTRQEMRITRASALAWINSI